MWTLIIILAFGSTSVAIDHIDGFVTAKSCNQASSTVTSAVNTPPADSAYELKIICIYKPLTATTKGQP